MKGAKYKQKVFFKVNLNETTTVVLNFWFSALVEMYSRPHPTSSPGTESIIYFFIFTHVSSFREQKVIGQVKVTLNHIKSSCLIFQRVRNLQPTDFSRHLVSSCDALQACTAAALTSCFLQARFYSLTTKFTLTKRSKMMQILKFWHFLTDSKTSTTTTFIQMLWLNTPNWKSVNPTTWS